MLMPQARLTAAGDGASKFSYLRLASLSLRARVMAVLVFVHVGLMVVAAWLLILNARMAIEEEVAASLDATRTLSLAVIGSRLRFDHARDVIAALEDQLPQTRHVRLMLMNGAGDVTWPRAGLADNGEGEQSSAPAWFRRLIAPRAQIISIPISMGLTSYGSLVISAEPSDEIEEVWIDFCDLFILLIIGLLGLTLIIYLLLGRTLAPIAKISAGLEGLERGDYRTRLAPVAVPDLHQIGERFNALAARLETTTREKERLGHRLVTLQDDERKAIAMDLHDEIGPCLFGLKVDARAIKNHTRDIADPIGVTIAERTDNLLEIVDRLQAQSRSMLQRLRPMALGEVPIGDLLCDLVDGFATQAPTVDWRIALPETTSFGETVDLTLYRMTQECLTNAARHAHASRVDVVLSRHDDILALRIADNGVGMAQGRPGHGLLGMRQRIEMLGGRLEITAQPGGGTCIDAAMPIEAGRIQPCIHKDDEA